jgi:hypothetical protein
LAVKVTVLSASQFAIQPDHRRIDRNFIPISSKLLTIIDKLYHAKVLSIVAPDFMDEPLIMYLIAALLGFITVALLAALL